MKPASDYADLGGGLAYWETYDPANKVNLYGSAVRARGRLWFVDPDPAGKGRARYADRRYAPRPGSS